MSVGGVGGGRKGGGAKGPKGTSGSSGSSGAGGVGGAKGGSHGKVDRGESLMGPSGLAGSANVGQAMSAVTAQAMEIRRQLGVGELKSREEATRRLVRGILEKKLRARSQKLEEMITDHLMNDPQMAKLLDRVWSKS